VSCTPVCKGASTLPPAAVAAEIYLDAIPAPRSSSRVRPAFSPPALQPVSRDFAFIVPADLAAENLLRAIRGADKTAITEVRLFDRFETAEGLSLAVEGHAPAGRQELHRRADR
jgi:phenylalanyl-tRNA synthetase beta chain